MRTTTLPTRRSSGGLALIVLVGAMALAGCQASNSLTGPTWQWTDTPATGQSAAPNPTDYTIQFRSDGTVAVKADCHDLRGTYATSVPLGLTITLAPTPIAACAGASRSDTYLEQLRQVEAYSTGGGALSLDLADDGGTLHFRPAGS